MKLIFFVLLVGLNVADVVSTLYALKLGGRETNAVVAKLMKVFDDPLTAMLVMKVAVLGVVYWQLAILPWQVLAGLCAFFVWVIWNNVGVIRRLQA